MSQSHGFLDGGAAATVIYKKASIAADATNFIDLEKLGSIQEESAFVSLSNSPPTAKSSAAVD